METCVRNGYYEEALDLNAHVRRMDKKHGDIPIIKVPITEATDNVHLHYANPKPRGIPSSACSGTSRVTCLHVALKTRGGRLADTWAKRLYINAFFFSCDYHMTIT